MKKRAYLLGFLLLSATTSVYAWSEAQTSNYFETIKKDPLQLLLFLQRMPKGADLHNHLGGASMAENLIRYGQTDRACIDPKTFAISSTPQCVNFDTIYSDTALYNNTIDAWSMRNFYPGTQSGHDHFFATFGKYGPIAGAHSGEILAEVAQRAEFQNESYLELMVTPDNNASGMLGKKLGWDSNLTALRQKLLDHGLNNIVAEISKNISTDEVNLRTYLGCKTSQPHSGCIIKIRYLYQVLREQPPAQVFAQLLAGFETASKDPRFVGINMVQPEDGTIAMRDYRLHMKMVGFLHNLYPNVHVSLHAGELNSTLVPYDGLLFHIRDAIETAHADRIGHGVDIAYENNPQQLLQKMAAQKNLVEINLSSNAAILGIKGDKHPLPLYLQYHVPVTLSTDDEGVLRTNLTEQYQYAVLSYQLSYPTIKNMIRNSLTYSFLPGKNLWESNCSQVTTLSEECTQFLNTNEKAKMQWDLEKQFKQFEDSLG